MKKVILSLMLCLITFGLWAQDVVIDRLLPGRLGITVLQQVNSFDDVRSLTIRSGKAGDNDFSLLQFDFPALEKLDLGGLDCEFLPNQNYDDGTLGRKNALHTVILPQNLKVVPRYFMTRCPLVEQIDIPASVVYVEGNAFSSTNLSQVTFHEGLMALGYASFSNCTKLERVILPASLISAYGAFYGCTALYDVTCLAPTPPFVRDEGLFGRAEKVEGTLHIPPGSNYGVAGGWGVFNHIEEIDMPPTQDIGVTATYVPYPFPSNHPNVTLRVGMDSLYYRSYIYTLRYAGQATVTGDGTLQLGAFNHELDIRQFNLYGSNFRNLTYDYFQSNSVDACWPSLIARSPLSATDVSVTHRFAEYKYHYLPNIWTFTSLPFDVKLSDLELQGEGLQWSIMKYSGEMRADARFDDVWVRQTADSTLHAGEGFIIAVGWDRTVTPQASIRYTAPASQRTAIFNTDNAVIPLRDHSAEFECDRGWNFVGNPYPCHFATKYFDLTGPFVIFDRGRYRTYSPIDDDYLLKPYEGFFIQKPWGHDALTLYKEGRFLSQTDYDNFKKQINAPRHVSSPDRHVLNMTLTRNGEEQDRCRLVTNPEAMPEYEALCDAVKFPAMDEALTSLWLTGNDGTRYAISEQPLSKGQRIALDAFFATEGDYTLAFDGKDLSGLLLTDIETGQTQDMEEPYTFHAEAGGCHGRFYICRADGSGDGVTYQNGTATIDGVTYQLDSDGIASVEDVTKEVETLEIPQTVTYQGATYTVYKFYHYTNNITYKHLLLPSSIFSTYISRGNPKKLESVTLQSLCPPGANYSSTAQRDTTDNLTYYVLPAALNRYKASPAYHSLPHIQSMSLQPQQLWAHYGLVQFDDTNKPTNKPDFYTCLNYYSSPLYLYTNNTTENSVANIEVEGTKNMQLGSFEYFVQYPLRSLTNNSTTRTDLLDPTLITQSPMTADKVATQFYTEMNELHNWPMFCLPYDLRPSDITGDFAYLVPTVRRYDGAKRAANGLTPSTSHDQHVANWQVVSTGETVPAGEGFIINGYIPYSSDRHFITLPAVNNERRNGIFDTSRTITLKDYPSARPEDRGWNLVGNAYPAYYAMSESDIATPYLVWGTIHSTSNNSPVYHFYPYTRDDNDFLLPPFQAFFVQYTDTQHEIHMPGSGRYHGYQDYEGRRPNKAPRLSGGEEPVRHLFDIELTGCGQHDRTRIVLNAAASTAFEPSCDVMQIPIGGATLLCTLTDGARFAINERPLPEENIALGLDIAAEGDYTLSLGKSNSQGLVLTDHLTGSVTSLAEGDYTFHIGAGRHDSRFSLSFRDLTHIGAFTLRHAETTLYDLQGRVVTGQPQPGIYIQNGKKIVIR